MKYNFDEIINREDTACIKYDKREEIFGKADLIPMWVADMDFKTPDFIIEDIKHRLNHEILGYTYRDQAFDESIHHWMLARHQWEIETSWISFSPGVVPGISLSVLAYTKPGDQIIVQPPVYFPFFSCIEGNQRKRVDNPLLLKNGRYFIDFEDLKKKINPRVKMLILSNPHNPGGSVWSKDELAELGKICIENEILIISDEIHSDLIFKPHKHTPLASLSNEIAMNSISFFAPSKTFNIAGLSTSYLLIPNPSLRERYLQILDTVHIGLGNIFGAIALQSAYNKGEKWLEELLAYLKNNIDYTREFLEKNIPEIEMMTPEATYLIWLDFRKLGISDKKLNHLLIKKAGIGMNYGSIFGKEGEGFQRMNIACPKPVLIKALEQLKIAIDSLKD